MSERRYVVTGASRGIGAAIVSELSRRGHSVIGMSRTGDCPSGQGVSCDMTDEVAVRKAFANIAATGPIAGLVNNAGLHLSSPSHCLPTADYEAVMALNATSVMVAAREVHPYLKSNGGGVIVNLGSFFDKLGVQQNLAYCASKAAVGAITRCLAVEWAKDRIAVMNVAPGYIETDLNRDFLARESVREFLAQRIPVGQPGTPQDVATLIGNIMDNQMSFLTGETIYIDGGQGMNH